jgi:hypothetical protein
LHNVYYSKFSSEDTVGVGTVGLKVVNSKQDI